MNKLFYFESESGEVAIPRDNISHFQRHYQAGAVVMDGTSVFTKDGLMIHTEESYDIITGRFDSDLDEQKEQE